jgi:hypothetical protein
MAAPTTATLAAIVKDERAYLVEWIAWHRLIGFDRLLVYSNDCSDGSDALLDRMAAAGLVEHHRWPTRTEVSAQVTAYADALGRAGTEWILFVDADEFLCLHRDETVAAFLARFPADVSAIALNWRMFGSAGHVWQGPEPVVERFVRAGPRGAHNERHCKTIARVADVEAPHVHRTYLARGRYVDAAGRDIEIERMGFTPTVEHDLVQVNHYVVKSRAEFEAKRRRGNAHLPAEAPNKYSTRDGPFFRLHDTNEEEDRAILRRLAELRAEMARVAALAGEPLRPSR